MFTKALKHSVKAFAGAGAGGDAGILADTVPWYVDVINNRAATMAAWVLKVVMIVMK